MIAKESGHWYHPDGEPAYTIIGKNGKERNTTLRDARKLNLSPSVTTVLKVIAAPGLEIWKQNQLLLAAATLPVKGGESVDSWCKRVAVDAGEHGREAAAKGTEIHGAIERHFLGKPVREYKAEVKLVADLLAKMGVKHIATEKSFTSPLGYGGKVDFEGVDLTGRDVVVDFKTQDFKGQKKRQYSEMVVQLAAYRRGRGKPSARLINIFISRNLEEPEVERYEWTEQECCSGLRKFDLALEYWQLEKGYKPEEAGDG